MRFGAWMVRTAAIIILSALCACGGSGSGGGRDVERPEAPTLTLTPQGIKTFLFTWPDVSDETEYRLLEDATGSSGYSQVATIFADETSYDHEVFLPGRVNARYILQACNDSGCSDSAVIYAGNPIAAIGYLKASNTGLNDEFGISVALSADGSTLAVGANQEDSNATGIGGNEEDNSAESSGAVYVFSRSGETWSQQAYVKASNTDANDGFGYSIALSADGSTLAVGASGEGSSSSGINGNQTDNSALSSGAVYVFTRSSATWSQQAYVKASNTGAGDYFGGSVALSLDGNTLAVGAPWEASSSTGINGNQNDNSAESSGAVYVFTRSGVAWSQQAYVKASNTDANDTFGCGLALSADGSTLAVGAVQEDSSATGVNSDQDDNSAVSSGAAYVFTRSGVTWSQQAYVKASNAGTGHGFGSSVALSVFGSTLVVGAAQEASSAIGIDGNQTDNSAGLSGAVYVFTRIHGTWSQQAYVKASNTDTNDRFGLSVAITGDGGTLGVGAAQEDSNAAGVGGSQSDNSVYNSGAVYLY